MARPKKASDRGAALMALLLHLSCPAPYTTNFRAREDVRYSNGMALIENSRVGFDYIFIEETPVVQRCALTTGRAYNNSDV